MAYLNQTTRTTMQTATSTSTNTDAAAPATRTELLEPGSPDGPGSLGGPGSPDGPGSLGGPGSLDGPGCYLNFKVNLIFCVVVFCVKLR